MDNDINFVLVCPNSEGGLIHQRGEKTYIKLDQQIILSDYVGVAKKWKISYCIYNSIQVLESLNWKPNQRVPGNILIQESLIPFNKEEPEWNLKIDGKTGITCTIEGNPIYRQTIFSFNLRDKSVIIEHDNKDEILKAQKEIEKKKQNEESELVRNIKSGKITEEISNKNSDILFHSLTQDTAFLIKLFFSSNNDFLSIKFSKKRLIFFEFKLFTIGYFLNYIRKDDSSKFKEFLAICISQLVQEIDSINLDAEESLLDIPPNFDMGEDYILEKIQYYMEDCEKYSVDPKYFPKFTYVSIKKHPLENTDSDFFDCFRNISFDNEFQENYKKVVWLLELRATDNAKFKLEKINLI